jgi:hypothetical protein
MAEATITKPTEPLKRIKDSFEHLRIRTTTVHHGYIPKRPQDHSELTNGPSGPPILLAELEAEMGALRGYLEGVRHAGWIHGIITIAIGSGATISGVIDVEADQPEQMATFETMLHELNRRAILLSERNIAAIIRCSFEPE